MKSEFYTASKDGDKAKEFVIKAKKIANIMAANYNQKKNAYEASLVSFNKSGSLDIGRIHSYKTSDDIFMKKKIVNQGKSHGLVCALDFSVSMRSLLNPIAMQFLITSLFCKYAKIDFRFFTFTSISLYGNKQNSAYKFLLSGGDKYARFVDIGNNTMSESELINSYYDILSFNQLNNIHKYPNTFSDKYKNYILKKFGSMGGTPLIPAMYQSYLVSKWMQDTGIQNVKILIINDGDNNSMFKTEASPTSIEDPYSKRIYPNEGSTSDSLLSSINKMARDNNIDTFNLFLGNQMSESKLKSILSDYAHIHGNSKVTFKYSDVSTLYTKLTIDSICNIDNLCYYNKVVIADAYNFPRFNDKSNKNSSNYNIKKNAKEIKSLTTIGKLISDFMVKDFRYVK